MQFPHTGVSPVIQLFEVTIHVKWDFFLCVGGHKLVPYLEYRFTFFFKKQLSRQQMD